MSATAALKVAHPTATIMQERGFMSVATQHVSVRMRDRRGGSETAVEFSTEPNSPV